MFSNTLIMALRAIRRNAMRSVLTILGIVIGVAAVVALVTIGEGATQQVANQIGALGENLLTVQPGAPRRPGGPPGAPSSPFTLEDATAIGRDIRGLDRVAPAASSKLLAVYGNTNWSTSVTGSTNDYVGCRGYSLDLGRLFTASDMSGGKPVCILGATVIEKLFAGAPPIDQRIRLGALSCTVVGTLAAKGQGSMGQDQDDLVLMPIKAFQRRVSGKEDVTAILVTVTDGYSTSAIRTQIESLLRERRKVAPGAEDNFNVRDMQEIAAAMQQTTTVLTTLLSAIAAVSLLVGGIGIMNIMLVSVTERTREIGIRLAIGANGGEVMMQFLTEAAVLSGFGGVIGLVLGNVGALAATKALDMPFIPSALVAAVAFFFSVMVGIVFGYLPAKRASRLNPIEALRHE
jgi:putative ABC transport system permease protein